jgi:hypothetical protein
LPSKSVIFQPIIFPASTAPAAGTWQPSAAWLHDTTQTALPGWGRGPLFGSGRSLPSIAWSTNALAAATLPLD